MKIIDVNLNNLNELSAIQFIGYLKTLKDDTRQKILKEFIDNLNYRELEKLKTVDPVKFDLLHSIINTFISDYDIIIERVSNGQM